MHLMLCGICFDIRGIPEPGEEVRVVSCTCGKALGVRSVHTNTITLRGPAIPLWVDRRSLEATLNMRPVRGEGRAMELVVLPVSTTGILDEGYGHCIYGPTSGEAEIAEFKKLLEAGEVSL